MQPVWFRQGDPSLLQGYGIFVGYTPGHYAAKITFPDGYVAYFDDGWEGTGGVFTFRAATGVTYITKPIDGERPSFGAEPGWTPGCGQ